MVIHTVLYSRLGGLMRLWCLLLVAATPLQAQTLLTLEEVVQRVLTNNFDIQMARNKQKIADKNHHIGKAGFLPSLDVNVGVNAAHSTWPQKPNSDTTNSSTGLELKWTVFNGMQSIATYQHLGKLSKISQLETQQKIEEKVAEAIKGYYGLALAQKKKHVLENCLAVSKEVFQLTKAKYEVGQCTRLDYLSAQVQHNEEQAKWLSQEEELAEARRVLHSLLGKDGPEDFAIMEDIPFPSRLSREVLTKALATANTSILVAQKYCENAALAVKMERSKLWPSIGVSLGYDLGSKRHGQRWEATSRGFKYGISVSCNLFNAFQHTTAIQKAGIEADNAYLKLEDRKMQLESALKKHFLHYTQQLQRYELAQKHVQVSQENVAVALEQYRLGNITLLTLGKTQQNAQETALKCWQALYDAKVTEIELQKLGGTLLNAAY